MSEDRKYQVTTSRRAAIKRVASGIGVAWIGAEGIHEFVLGGERSEVVGFRHAAPETLDRCSREAQYYERIAGTAAVACRLCPHGCVLEDEDRGFCRARVVKNGTLYTVAYGNLCSVAIDPIEKKPLYHFLPESPIVSVAMGGCNLRCPNCQNWEISQAFPEEVKRVEAMPVELVQMAQTRGVASIAYTYTEPLVSYEYVLDASERAHAAGVKNVLVTAGYINEAPLRRLCRVIDAATLDVKSFRDAFYRTNSRGRLGPVLKTLEVLREEGVWVEVSFLMVTSLSDNPDEVGQFARWMVQHLGAETPLHLLRFHPAHRLMMLPPTPESSLKRAYEQSKEAGLSNVYLGNVQTEEGGITRCRNGHVVVERRGYRVMNNSIKKGRCPTCGAKIAGVFAD